MRISLAFATALAATPAAGDFVLRLPVDCAPGENCHIQNYFDHLPSPQALDYRCGGLSYDGHKGTDFALPTLAEMREGVAVLAAAHGIVRGVRDGMPDRKYSPQDASRIADRECGNGVAIVHEGGWETQYCHLRQGSVEVAPGDRVSAGTVLGQIGLSGKTQFPHLHLSVRRNGQEVDPFAPDGPSASCGAPKDDLWDVAPRYQPGGLLTAGFSDAIPEYETVLAGTAAKEALEPASPAMVLFGHAFGGRTGDIIRLRVSGPDGTILSHESVLEKAQAQLFRAAGRPLTAPRWPAGEYIGTVEMVRDGRPFSSKSVSIFIP